MEIKVFLKKFQCDSSFFLLDDGKIRIRNTANRDEVAMAQVDLPKRDEVAVV